MREKEKKSKWQKILKYSLVALGVIACIFIISNNNVLADVGNNNRYDDGGGSSGGSIDLGWIIYILFELFGPIPGIIVLVILIIVFFYLKKKGKLNNILNSLNNINMPNYSNGQGVGVNNTKQVAEEIRKLDPNFSEDKFIGWAREVFVKIQQAWSDRNWKIIRPFESQELFSQHNAQLEEYIKNNKINKIEKVNVNYCALRDFKVDGDKEVLTVELHAIMRDYVIDATTNKVLESDPNKDWHMNYIMTFNRKVGVKTEAGVSNKSTTNCPNCGAPTEITSAGQCEYCKSVITTGEHDWVLSDITSIR